MIELRVTLKNIKMPNDIVKKLNEMIDDMSFITSIVRVRAVTNGNHCGYGLVHIIEQLPTPLNDDFKRKLSIIVYNIISDFQKRDDVELVEVFNGEGELTNFFVSNYDILSDIKKDKFLTVKKLI